MTSIRDIAATIDPARWPPGALPQGRNVFLSLKELAAGHRWLGVPPEPPRPGFIRPLPDVVSLAEVVKRHDGPSSAKHRFLSYNTYLLPGVPLPWNEYMLEDTFRFTSDMLRDTELDPADVLAQVPIIGSDVAGILRIDVLDHVDQLKISVSSIADDLGVGFVGDAIGALIDFVRTIGMSVDDVRKSALKVLDGMRKTALDIVLEVGQDVTAAFMEVTKAIGPVALLRYLGMEVPQAIAAKPLLAERTEEIGSALSGRFDIMALSEVFLPKTQERIVAHLGRGADVYFGPGPLSASPGEFAALGSGLFTVTVGRRIVKASDRKQDQLVFSERGSKWKDIDAWSNKGALRTVVDVGVGNIEVYNVHTMYGGGSLFTRNYPDMIDLRLEQVRELMEFYRGRHDPRNVCVITGDFNLDAQTPEIYGELTRIMTAHGFFDAWLQWNGKELRRSTALDTTENIIDHDAICANDASQAPHGFCEFDLLPLQLVTRNGEPEAAFDYVWIEFPTAEHRFNLDVTRVRRMPFRRPRGAMGVGSYPFMSDHIGLELTLLTSPRPPVRG